MNLKTLAAFTLAQRDKAADIAQRLRAGETIPLPELSEFLEGSGKILQAQTRQEAKAPKQTDVDFF